MTDTSRNKFSALEHMSAHEQRTIVIVTVVVVSIAFIISGYYYFGLHRHGNTATASTAYVEIQSSGFPEEAVVTINSHGSRGLSVEGQGTAIVVGEGSLGTTTKYYLIMDPVSHSTELYQQNVANSKIGLMQLTQSQTQKAALSVDMLSGEAAYLSDSISANTLSPVLPATTASTTAAANDAHVIVWNPSTKKETDFGIGSNPVLLPGGFFVVFERADTLVSVQTQTMKEYQLLTIPSKGLYAIDQKHMKVAIYDPRSSLVQIFSLASSVGLSAESSTRIALPPAALTFDDAGKTLGISVSNKSVLMVTIAGAIQFEFSKNDIPGNQLLPMVRISLHYE